MATNARILDKLGSESLHRYPDYEAGKPPRLLNLHQHTYLEEYEKIWGRRWGAMGIGRLCSWGGHRCRALRAARRLHAARRRLPPEIEILRDLQDDLTVDERPADSQPAE